MNRFRTLLTLCILFAAVAPLQADEVRTLDNKVLTGKITNVTDKEVTIQTADKGAVVTPIQQVVTIDLVAQGKVTGVPAGTKYSDVRLIDETALLCSKVTFVKDSVHLTLLSGQQVKLKAGDLLTVLHGAENEKIRKEWETILAEKDVKRDRVVILRDEELNAVEGTFGEVDPKGKTVQFRLEGGINRDISFDIIQGMIFYRTEEVTKSPVCQVYDLQGNTLPARSVAVKGNDFILTTVGGIEITWNRDTIARLDYNLGKQTFLSDVEPSKVDDAQSKVLGRFPAYRANLNLSDTQIQIDGKPFPKGLSLWAPIGLEYNLRGKYKEFKALVGIDNQVGGGGKVRLTFECDGREVRRCELAPGMPTRIFDGDGKELKRDDKEAKRDDKETKREDIVEFSLVRVNRLRIIVTAEDSLGFSAHVEIAEPRVTQ